MIRMRPSFLTVITLRWWTTRAAIVGLTLFAFTAIPAPARAIGSPTVTTLESSQNPSPACGLVTFKATVFGALFPDSPEGGVQFLDGGSTLGNIQIITPDFDTVLGAHVVPTDHSSATITVALSGGSHLITVFYAGTDVPSHGGPLVQNVSAATSTTVVTSAVNPSVFGQPVPLTAAVSSSCPGSVAGSVQFRADGSDLGGPQLVDGSGHATFSASGLGVGTHPVDAIFSSNNSDVTGSAGSLAGGQIVNPADTTTSVSASANPSEFGAGVTFTAATTVNAPGSGTATGSVQFQDNGTNLGAPLVLSGGGQAMTATANLTVGSHAISAFYTSGSPNFYNSSGVMTQLVNKARTTLSYDGASGADFNDPAGLSAQLTRTDNGAPIAGKAIALTMGAESCAAVTDLNGQAGCTVTPSDAAGPFAVTAVFADDGNFIASADSQPFTVTREETTTAYTGPTVIAQGNPVTLAGRLLEDGSSPIIGRTLTLAIGSGATAQVCTTVPTDAAGNARCIVPNVAVGQGPQPVEASFLGDGYYLPSSATRSVIIFAFPSRGIFVLGNQTVGGTPSSVTYWGAQWAKQNSLAGGAPSAFKGFADEASSTPPACGGTWTTSPGNSPSPVDTVPAYMGLAVSSSIVKNGSVLSGNIISIVVVVTDPGYGPNPGHSGTGTIIATYC
jgi:hypothetical protein